MVAVLSTGNQGASNRRSASLLGKINQSSKYPGSLGRTAGPFGGVFVVLVLMLSLPAAAQLTEGNERLSLPQSHLDEPFENPIFVTVHGAYGGGFQKQPGDWGYGGSLVFRPGSPINIFNGWWNWKTGMVLQVDYLEVPEGGDILSGDLIMRRYFNNRGTRKVEVNMFLGMGSGVSRISRPDPDDIAAGDHWSILAEAGQEWFFKPAFTFFLKGQYRWMINAGRTYRTWSVLVGVGLDWP